MQTEFTFGDAQARHEITTALDGNLIVEASAGTGKTTMLVARMVALIRRGQATCESLVAVTFTRKAAAQLRQRFQSALMRATRQAKSDPRADPAEIKRLRGAERSLERCFIGTIHAFCARLIRERPVEAGVEPDFEEMEPAEDAAVRGECWRFYVERLLSEQGPLVQTLAELRVDFAHLERTYGQLSAYPDVEPAWTEVPDRPDLSGVREGMRGFLERAAAAMPSQPPAMGWDPVQQRVQRALRLCSYLNLDDEPDLVTIMKALEYGGNLDRRIVTLNRWRTKESARECDREFRALIRHQLGPGLKAWREYLHPILLRAILPALELYHARRRARGRLNYQDLLVLARDLLRDHPPVRRYFQQRYRQLLVDEFQDTDPIQAEIMLYLTGSPVREKRWRRLKPRPGSLFIVGDPKQSIYRFRRADIETYNQVKEIVVRAGGRALPLTTNFRSAAPICDWVNEVFEGIFPEASSPEQPAHSPLQPHRGAGGPLAGVHRLVTPSRGRESGRDIAARNAAQLGGWILWALQGGLEVAGESEELRPVTAADFMVITRNRAHLGLYAQALERRGIPYEVSGGGSYGESEELQALLPFLQSATDPDDPVALVAFLRGPLSGVSDLALYHFVRAGGRFHYLQDPPADCDARIASALARVRKAHQWVRTLPPGAALARIVSGLGLLAQSAALERADTRTGNLLKTLGLARHLSAQGKAWTAVLENLRRLIETGDLEEMSVVPGSGDRVRIMNLHRAKGLEAKVVCLVDPRRTADFPPDFYVDRERDPPRGHFVFTERRGLYQAVDLARPLDWEEMAEREKAFQRAEAERLLYVAATRAAEVLVVSVAQQQERLIGPWKRFKAHLGGRDLELPVPSELPPAPEPEKLDLAAELAEFRHELGERRAMAAAPSYAVRSVTRVVHDTDTDTDATSQVPGGGTGRGRSWGRVLHRLLEALLLRGERLDLLTYAGNLLAGEGRDRGEVDELLRVVEGVTHSPLWRAAQASSEHLVEVPFAVRVPAKELGSASEHSAGDGVLSGQIDLVFRDPSRGDWVIVDYKSDVIRAPRGERLGRLVEHYAPQLRIYQRHWRELTGEPARAALFFIDSGDVEWIN